MSEVKFKLTSESKVNAFGVRLFRIEATESFGNVKQGDKGGWVESTHLPNGKARLSGNAWIYDNAQVYGNAQVFGSARVYDDARLSGNARVLGNARLSGDAWVSGNARVLGNARLSGNARVLGNARVSGNARVYDDAQVYGDARVSGSAWVFGDAKVSLKKRYGRGAFLYASDADINTTVIDQSTHEGFDSDRDYKNLLVVGDFEISDIDEKPKETISIGGKTYEVTEELKSALSNLKEV